MKITRDSTSDACVIHFCGSADIAAVSDIRQVLGESMSRPPVRVVCDLSGMDYICSDALGAFISAHECARESGGFVRLLAPQQRVNDILKQTRLNRLFEVYDSLDDALD